MYYRLLTNLSALLQQCLNDHLHISAIDCSENNIYLRHTSNIIAEFIYKVKEKVDKHDNETFILSRCKIAHFLASLFADSIPFPYDIP